VVSRLTDTTSSAFRTEVLYDHFRIDSYTNFREPGKKGLGAGRELISRHVESGFRKGLVVKECGKKMEE
jgi:hypothetical protein